MFNKFKDWLRIRRNTTLVGVAGVMLGVAGGQLGVQPLVYVGAAIFLVALAGGFLLKGKF